jgi:histidinol-phosphate aminotransferase
MKAYSSARDEFSGLEGVFLDANENPNNNGVNRYPDPFQTQLKHAISSQKSIATKNILIGNGSDEVLDLIFRAFCEPKLDNIVLTAPSYGMYKVLANLNDISIKEVLYEEDFTLDADKIIQAVNEQTKLIILCSPNNPTGNCIDEKIIEKILKSTNCLVLIDEAYVDFSEKPSNINLLGKYTQLIISQTLSKFYGMAGLRLGICFANEEIVSILSKIKPPYNINILSQNKAIELLKKNRDDYRNEVIKERKKLIEALSLLSLTVKIYPSEANFILVKITDADSIYNQLLKRKIIIRNRTNEALCKNCVRITIGSPEENELLIEVLKEIDS